MANSDSIRRLVWYILCFPVAVIFFPYVLGVISRTEDWFFADPRFIESSRSVFLDRYNSVGELLSSMSVGIIVGLLGGIGIWLYDNYERKKYAVEIVAEAEAEPETREQKPPRSFLRWILICTVGLNLLLYIGAVMLNLHSWVFLDPDFIDQPAIQYIFLDRRETVGELLKHKLFHAAILSLLGTVLWLTQLYYSRKDVP